MKEFTIVLDGITVQHAGELLFDTQVTSTHRANCKETYIRCLEDFAFATAYGSRFAVSGSLPQVGDESPGLILINEYQNKLTTINTDYRVSPEAVLSWKEFQKRLTSDLPALGYAYQRQHMFWDQFIVREAESYLGNHESLYLDADDLEILVFAKRPVYLSDRYLQNLIPQSFISSMVRAISVQLPVAGIKPSALSEFVSRASFTHIAIFWWYEIAAAAPLLENGIRLPHITRSLLRSVQKENDQKELLGNTMAMLSRHALFDAVAEAKDREEVIDRLHVLPSIEPYPAIRQLLDTLFGVIRNEKNEIKREKAINSIHKDIRKLTIEKRGNIDNIDLQVQIKAPAGLGSFTLSGIQPFHLKEIFSQQRRALRTLYQVGDSSSPSDYLASLNVVFPELELDK
jgi:hypothetical protein